MLEINDWYKFLETCLTQPVTRQRILKYITVSAPGNWQSVHTPFHIVREMCDLIPNENDLGYYVFFSNEFLEVLIHERNIDPKKVLFLPDNELEGKLMKKVYGCNYHVLDKSILQNKTIDLSGIPMKFDKLAVIGNPPYQEGKSETTSQAKPVYNLFTEAVIDFLKPTYFSFIIPTRWLSGGIGLKSFRDKLLSSNHLGVLKHWSGPNEIFKDVWIYGGVCYFLYDMTKVATFTTIISDGIIKNIELTSDFNNLLDFKALGIVDKIGAINKVSSLCKSINTFGLATNYSNFDFNGMDCYFRNRTIRKVKASDVKCLDIAINKYKVLIPPLTHENGSFKGDQKQVITNMFIAKPNQVCTQTYLVIADFGSEVEAINFSKYIKSKFFRFLSLCGIQTQHISKDSFRFVPDMEDYSKVWTDEELYKHFELTQEEIDYIESKVK